MMTLENQIDMADGDVDGYAEPSILSTKKTSPNNTTNKENTAAHNGNENSSNANAANNSTVSRPKEAYDRLKHYGKTPTSTDRKVLGATKGQDIDHTIPLVQHYYEGDGIGIPGWQMAEAERKLWAQNRAKMTVKSQGKNRSEGAKLSQYSKEKKKQYNLQTGKKKKS